jgi:HK97 family phage prohead protease
MSHLQEAAAARAAGMKARADRPSQRCRDEGGPANRTPAIRLAQLQLRDDGAGTPVTGFTGYASVTSQGYKMWDMFGEYTEVVTQGAFAKTLAEPDLDVPLVLQHDSLRRIARTTNGSLRLSEDDTGLLVDADLDPADADVAYIAPKMRAGLIDEMSFMFRITDGQWSDDWMEFHINAVDLNRGDVAIVGYGASPLTSAQLRVAQRLQQGRALDAEDVNVLTQAMAWFTAVDSIVDEAQEALAAYLKVPSPDPDDADDMPMLSAPKTPARSLVTDEDVRLRVLR